MGIVHSAILFYGLNAYLGESIVGGGNNGYGGSISYIMDGWIAAAMVMTTVLLKNDLILK